MDTDAILRKAHIWAQYRFHKMLEAGVYGDPNDTRTVAYIAAERRVDDLLRDAQWETAKAEFDAVIAHSLHDEPVADCDDCQEASAAMWTRMAV